MHVEDDHEAVKGGFQFVLDCLCASLGECSVLRTVLDVTAYRLDNQAISSVVKSAAEQYDPFPWTNVIVAQIARSTSWFLGDISYPCAMHPRFHQKYIRLLQFAQKCFIKQASRRHDILEDMFVRCVQVSRRIDVEIILRSLNISFKRAKYLTCCDPTEQWHWRGTYFGYIVYSSLLTII